MNVEQVYPLAADVGRPLPGGGEPTVSRRFFASSGRVDAWAGALREWLGRPLLGFGFGTEARVFDDRYYTFVGGLPENSYVGLLLQLGVVGLAALLALVGGLVLAARRAILAGVPAAAACLGVVTAGLLLGLVQSYLYAVGNIGAAALWTSAFLLPALAAPRRPA